MNALLLFVILRFCICQKAQLWKKKSLKKYEVKSINIIEKNINDIIPYENNPRNNENAVDKVAASRHTVFNYAKIADYYAHADAKMQSLMEQSALVIIDFEDAIKNGYARLSDEIATMYMEDTES